MQLAGAIALTLAALLTTTARAEVPTAPPDIQALGRSLLKQLVETNTTHAFGSTVAAEAVRARLLEAGFPPADVVVAIPPDHPTKGNVIVRLHGTGRKPPVLWIGHLDVVEAPRADWTYDPFKLTEEGGWLYGRGTYDMKGDDAAMLAAIIRLRREGWRPDRDIILALTADEEAGGDADGVDWLLRTHRGLIDAALVINPDGGSAATRDGRRRYLIIQTAEKIFVTYQLEATDKGGHSSEPTPANPIYRLARVLARLDAFAFPIDLTATAKAYFRARAALESGQMRADMLEAASATPSPAALARLAANPENALYMRTTCVATMIEGGQGESALPERAKALIQCRVIPGEPTASIQATLARVIDDPKVTVSIFTPETPSPESPPSPEVSVAVKRVVASMWPGLPVLPEMSAGASDSAFTRQAGLPSYGVDGLFSDEDDDRAHGRDERISIQSFGEELEFTYRLMKTLSAG